MYRSKLMLVACVFALCAGAHADSLVFSAQSLASGLPFGPNNDSVLLGPGGAPFQSANTNFLLQLGNFAEGAQPVYVPDPYTGAPTLLPGYDVGTFRFAAVDDITITDYNDAFQQVNSVERYVTLSGTDTSTADGTRTLTFDLESPVSFGSLGSLLLFPTGGVYGPYDSGPFKINAYLMQLPSIGNPTSPTAVTPEPSAFLMTGTGALSAMTFMRRKRRS